MSIKPKWLQHLVEFLIDNLPVLFTIGFAGYIIGRQEIAHIAVSTGELLTAILGVLALLATSEMIERYRRLQHIKRSADQILALLDRVSGILYGSVTSWQPLGTSLVLRAVLWFDQPR